MELVDGHSLPDEEAACQAFARALVSLPRALDAELVRSTNLSLNEYNVLSVLAASPARTCRVTDLAAAGSLSLSGVSRLVDRLFRQGLVGRENSVEDRRGVLVSLTDDGVEVVRAGHAAQTSCLRRTVLANLEGISLNRLRGAFEAMADVDAGGLEHPKI
ncbi:MarR family transcriptional regulator [Actinoplanes sp. NPDC049596]|uniref:MarR family winged helix-turn-helix transcriptional regulator n=1 Tax=unclassified Actinoplanes TaxID=2626549 RepID=UPI0034274FED